MPKRKKINYGGIPKHVLDMVMGECYGLGDYTLKDELDKYCEDIIAVRYNIQTPAFGDGLHLEWFHAWSKNYAMVLIDTPFNDRVILGINRNPPEELCQKKSKKNKKS